MRQMPGLGKLSRSTAVDNEPGSLPCLCYYSFLALQATGGKLRSLSCFSFSGVRRHTLTHTHKTPRRQASLLRPTI